MRAAESQERGYSLHHSRICGASMHVSVVWKRNGRSWDRLHHFELWAALVFAQLTRSEVNDLPQKGFVTPSRV